MDISKVNQRLDRVDETLTEVLGMIATGASLVRLVGGLVRGKMSPDQAKTFDTAIAEYEAQRSRVLDEITKFRQEFGGTSQIAGVQTGGHGPQDGGVSSGPTGGHAAGVVAPSQTDG